MPLIGSRAAFELVRSDRGGVCRECGQTWKKGDVVLVSRREVNVMKIVCSDDCRKTFDDRYWQDRADKREKRGRWT